MDIKIWNMLTGRLLSVFRGHSQMVAAISFCNLETEEEANRNECKVYFVTGNENGEAKLWRPSFLNSYNAASDIAPEADFSKLHDRCISAITLHPAIYNDHEHIAVFVSKDKSANIWRIKDNNEHMVVDIALIVHLRAVHTDLINSVPAYRDEQCSDHELVIITASTYKSLRYWKISTDRKYAAEEPVMPLLIKSNAHVKAVTCIATYTLTTKGTLKRRKMAPFGEKRLCKSLILLMS